MFCCSKTKKPKLPQQIINKTADNIQQEETFNVNDEAFTFQTTLQMQHINTMQTFKLTHDQQTIRSSRSNSRGTRGNEHVAQTVCQFRLRKTPFLTFKKKGTDQTTKYLSTKQGYTLLVTGISN